MIAAGAYLVTTSGSYWYPLQVSANSALYACQIDFALCYNSATGIPAGWSYPSSGLWTAAGTLAGTSYTAQITIPTGMSSIMGISPASYPPSLNYTSTYTITSNITPQINPISSYFLTCSLVNNPTMINPTILTSFTNRGTTIGQLISVEPPEYAWISVPDQSINVIRMGIIDQSYNPVQLRDPQITIMLLIRQRADASN